MVLQGLGDVLLHPCVIEVDVGEGREGAAKAERVDLRIADALCARVGCECAKALEGEDEKVLKPGNLCVTRGRGAGHTDISRWRSGTRRGRQALLRPCAGGWEGTWWLRDS